ncbi:uncharacterized protein Eint_020840 [Encephalitozoon intestinalis ATCC 50506]|uniref:Uncharacterized protein n=1 Tax=Encephalitozoon intestinalis (strain ATCC 50506) TaxID=876142 RepID=E0S5U7_ENCIT|nr:uncharacterized protein Eint_020840 [Encephalitozoon intestinalis ATCC 50506]ADM11082.1 hypothetical protein Eint_020840 [Encephalitozoon intestinalis ATCC 50506]
MVSMSSFNILSLRSPMIKAVRDAKNTVVIKAIFSVIKKNIPSKDKYFLSNHFSLFLTPEVSETDSSDFKNKDFFYGKARWIQKVEGISDVIVCWAPKIFACYACEYWFYTICCSFFSNSDQRISKGGFHCFYCRGVHYKDLPDPFPGGFLGQSTEGSSKTRNSSLPG